MGQINQGIDEQGYINADIGDPHLRTIGLTAIAVEIIKQDCRQENLQQKAGERRLNRISHEDIHFGKEAGLQQAQGK